VDPAALGRGRERADVKGAKLGASAGERDRRDAPAENVLLEPDAVLAERAADLVRPAARRRPAADLASTCQ
jgi:hypothetical protein